MTATRPRAKRASAFALTLFALPFAGIGIGSLVWGVKDVLAWQRMSAWAAVSADLLGVELEEHDDDEGSTTYETTATYRYSYAGQDYTSNRVAIGSGSDNIGDFQRTLYWQLRSAQERGTPVTAYVDPMKPTDAVLNRDLRWGMLAFQGIFVVMFGGAGFGLLFGALHGRKKLAVAHGLADQFPNEPWRWRPEWAGGRIASSTRTAAYVAIVFAVLWNLISLPALLLIPGEVADGNLVAAVGLLFPLVGVGLAAWAIRSWLQLRRFKVATFTLQRVPVALGGRLKGSIRVEAEVPGVSDFRLELACVEERVTGSGKSRQRSERLLWQKEWRVPRHQCQISSLFTSLPVDIAMPSEQPATSVDDVTPKIEWRLDVTGECTGPDFWSRFELPVFDVGERRVGAEALSPAASASTGSRAVPASPAPDAPTLASLGIRYERLAQGGEAWTFRRGHDPQARLGITGFALGGLFLSGVLFAMDMPIVFPLVMSTVDALFLYWALSLWFTEYRVTLERGSLTLSRHGFMARAPVEIPLNWIRRVRTKRGLQTGNKLHYDLEVETNEGAHTAASSLSDYDVASWLAQHWMAGGARAS